MSILSLISCTILDIDLSVSLSVCISSFYVSICLPEWWINVYICFAHYPVARAFEFTKIPKFTISISVKYVLYRFYVLCFTHFCFYLHFVHIRFVQLWKCQNSESDFPGNNPVSSVFCVAFYATFLVQLNYEQTWRRKAKLSLYSEGERLHHQNVLINQQLLARENSTAVSRPSQLHAQQLNAKQLLNDHTTVFSFQFKECGKYVSYSTTEHQPAVQYICLGQWFCYFF